MKAMTREVYGSADVGLALAAVGVCGSDGDQGRGGARYGKYVQRRAAGMTAEKAAVSLAEVSKQRERTMT
jgi:hypothetical protein